MIFSPITACVLLLFGRSNSVPTSCLPITGVAVVTKASVGQSLGNPILGAVLEAGVVGEGRGVGESRAAVHIRRQLKIIGDHNVVEPIGEQRPIRKLALVQRALSGG